MAQKKWKRGENEYDGTSFFRKVTSVAEKEEMRRVRVSTSEALRNATECDLISEKKWKRGENEYDQTSFFRKVTSGASFRNELGEKYEYDAKP